MLTRPQVRIAELWFDGVAGRIAILDRSGYEGRAVLWFLHPIVFHAGFLKDRGLHKPPPAGVLVRLYL